MRKKFIYLILIISFLLLFAGCITQGDKANNTEKYPFDFKKDYFVKLKPNSVEWVAHGEIKNVGKHKYNWIEVQIDWFDKDNHSFKETKQYFDNPEEFIYPGDSVSFAIHDEFSKTAHDFEIEVIAYKWESVKPDEKN